MTPVTVILTCGASAILAAVAVSLYYRGILRRERQSRLDQEEELRRSDERFRLAAGSDRLTLFEQDAALRYRWFYPQRPHHAHGMGRSDDELLPPDDAGPLLELKRRVLREGIPVRQEIQVTFEGGIRAYDITIAPKRARSGEIDGIAGAAFDISDRKRAEEALEQARAVLSDSNAVLERRVRERTASLTDTIAQLEAFSYSVSHDLRSPLRAISGFTRILGDDFGHGLSPPVAELVRRIGQRADRMERLIADLLSYSRVAHESLELKPVPLEPLLRQVIDNAPECQYPRASIVVEGPLPDVQANELLIVQIFANLLSNAVKFVAAGRTPEVVVRATAAGGRVRIGFRDNGIGVAPEHHRRLFTLFERVHASAAYEGTGLGLAIVRRAAERMGGTAGLESDGTNGSLFWVDLPAVATEGFSLSASAGASGPSVPRPARP